MVLYPDAQCRAQQELDEVIGRDRLPSISDQTGGRLKYVEAVMKETLRWNSVGPIGIPHVCTEEDEYMGYRIPKGAVVIANIWCVDLLYFSLSCFLTTETPIGKSPMIQIHMMIHRLSSQNATLGLMRNLTHCSTHLDMEEGEESPGFILLLESYLLLIGLICNLPRRICPGKDLAVQSLFLAICMVLATFKIGTVRDDNGHEIVPKCEFTAGGIS